jgi:hypothetical protein
MGHAAAGEAAVDEMAEALAQSEDQPGREQQNRRRADGTQPVGPEIGKQQSERAEPGARPQAKARLVAQRLTILFCSAGFYKLIGDFWFFFSKKNGLKGMVEAW